MSTYRWFDTGFASLAKTALKEAQKKIDKVLDIQDEDGVVSAATTQIDTGIETKSEIPLKSSQTLPNMPNVPNNATTEREPMIGASNWGSFTGSFFDNPNANEMVTTPPKASALSEVASAPNLLASNTETEMKSESIASASDSVELLSPPTSSTSELPTPTGSAANNSESVELITATSSSSEAIDLVSPSSQQSIVIITSSDINNEDDDEDSTSYTTVLDETLIPNFANNSLNKSHVSSSEDADKTASSITLTQSDSSVSTSKLVISMEDVPLETQTVDSDSTQSFEEIQMQSSTSARSFSFDDKQELSKHTAQNYTSPHSNSNDEADTTTSSDIEIISNPNGDSSSNSTTRTSPQKQKKNTRTMQDAAVVNEAFTHVGPCKKGHFREPSEISILSEDSQSEMEKLLHRISELGEIIETRDIRLLQFEQDHVALQERNKELQAQLDLMQTSVAHLDSAEKYTQRMSALEKKFQLSIRERDALREELRLLKDDLQNKIPKKDLEQIVIEKNKIIEELQLEGEKLSKEILQQSNIIKKLRAKEKTTDAMLKKNKEEITQLQNDNDKLKKTLNAKEEVERAQIEAVHKMSSENRKMDEENVQLHSRIEDLQMKLNTLQTSFDAVKAELQQRSRLHIDLTRSTEDALAVKKQRDLLKAENEQIALQLAELREKVRSSEQHVARREQQLSVENKELLRRLEAAELRAENSSQEVSLTTIPLMRQLESLQNTLSQRQANWNKEEKFLRDKLDAAQNRLKSLEHMEATFADKLELLQARCKELEDQLSQSLMQEEKTQILLQQMQLNNSLQESGLNKQISSLSEEIKELQSKITTLENENEVLKNEAQQKHENLAHFGTSTEENYTLQQNFPEPDSNEVVVVQLSEQQQRAASPATSFDRNSLEEVMGVGTHSDWQHDEFDCVSNSGRQSIPYAMQLSFMGHNSTSTLEHLQALLKQRDGELTHLQWEMSRLQAERGILNDEIASLTVELENLKEKMQSYETIETTFAELQNRYDALLQMYGEKVELAQELQLDLTELKDAYRTQINELLSQKKSSA